MRVASGEPLPKRQEELSINGHAIEARLYAEDPAKGFLPSTGRITWFEILAPNRTETGIEKGDMISPFYDPMIAKIVVHADNRGNAVKGIAKACAQTQVLGVKTNAGFLARLVGHPQFAAESLDTGFIDRFQSDLTVPDELHDTLLDDAATVLLSTNLNPTNNWHPPSIAYSYFDRFESDPWRQNYGFRLNADWDHIIAMNVDGKTVRQNLPDDYFTRRIEGARSADGVAVFRGGEALKVKNRWDGTGQASAADGAIIAPMPGKVIAVDVAEGQAVTAGQRLMVLEAMKMEHALAAPFDGVIEGLAVSAGGQVQVEAVLCRVVPQ
ncbi:MAG: hypothetical protein C0496_00450 [Erythrobacter sp.]|nr:hypothetical protein [Erythrobacter sp.]